jgi:chromosome partitioning protein
MLALVAEARIYRPDLVARFVLNRCAARTVLARETAENLADHDPPVLAATIGQRIAFAAAAQSGRLVSELDGETPAAREIAALADEIEHLGIGRAAL